RKSRHENHTKIKIIDALSFTIREREGAVDTEMGSGTGSREVLSPYWAGAAAALSCSWLRDALILAATVFACSFASLASFFFLFKASCESKQPSGETGHGRESANEVGEYQIVCSEESPTAKKAELRSQQGYRAS